MKISFLSIVVAIGLSLLQHHRIANAEIIVLKCDIANNSEPIYFTRYSDASPPRVGTSPGVGNKALYFKDRFGAQIFIETNTDGAPITFTTIQRDLIAVHARQVLNIDGTVLAPSQTSGRCEQVNLR